MDKKAAVKKFTDYLRKYNIYYESSIDHGAREIIMVYHAEDAPGECIEGCIWFYNDSAEVRAYYSEVGAEICRDSAYRGELLKLLNYINARVFLKCGNPQGLYEPHMLYTPRIYMTEDGNFDITITTMINYDFWEIAPLETADYITIYCPELLDRLTYPVFGVLLGKLSADDAKERIRQEILEEHGN